MARNRFGGRGGVAMVLAVASAGFLAAPAARAAAGEVGVTPISHHPFDAFRAADYNNDLAVGEDGTVWVGNASALLGWDGTRWEVVHHPDDRHGFHSPVQVGDRVHAAVNGDLGWFERGTDREFTWTSLLDQLPVEARGFGRVIGPARTRDGIWYLTTRHLVLLRDGGSVLVASVEDGGNWIVGGDDFLWLSRKEAGIVRARVAHDAIAFESPPGLERTTRMVVTDLVPVGNDEIRFVTAAGAYVRWRGGAVEYIGGSADRRYAPLVPLSLARLRDGHYALGFLRGGVWIVADDGAVLSRHDRESDDGLFGISALAEDAAGGVWVAQNNGVARIDRGAGITLFGADRGIDHAHAVVRQGPHLIAAGRSGVHILRGAEGDRSARFERLAHEPAGASDLLAGKRFVYATGGAVWRFELDAAGGLVAARSLPDTARTRRMARSRRHPDRFYAIDLDGGVSVVDGIDDDVQTVRRIDLVDGTASRIGVDSDEGVWIGTNDGQLWRIDVDADPPSARRFGPENGVPATGETEPESLGDDVAFVSDAGLLRFDRATGRLVPDPSHVDGDGKAFGLFKVHEDVDGNHWARGPVVNGVWWRRGEGWEWDTAPFQALAPTRTVHNFLREGSILWLAQSDGVVRIDLDVASRPPPAMQLALDRVFDSANGVPLPIDASNATAARNPELRVSLLGHGGPFTPRFRYRLAGFDASWSPWTDRESRRWTNLPGGDYRLEVEAIDRYGRHVPALEAKWSVPPFWWQRWWVVGLLLLGFAATIASVAIAWQRRRVAQLELRKRELEDTVTARTTELAASNLQLSEQAQRLRELDALKSRLFDNVSHEFRTPLTLVLGPLQDLLEDTRNRIPPRQRELLEMAQRNASRLLELILELMDLNRLEQGHLPMRWQSLPLRAFIERMAEDFSALAQRHGQTLRLEIGLPAERIALLDPVQIERSVSNLVGNAIKFGQRGNEVWLRADVFGDGSDRWRVEVVDQGPGIPADVLPHVFERFYQGTQSDSAQGAGIGLALVREIVEAHQGEVSCVSVPGEGSRFALSLPWAPSATGVEAPFNLPVESDTEVGQGSPVDGTPGDAEGEAVEAEDARPLVLVVEDHDELRSRLRDLLAERYRVRVAANGETGLAAAQEALPDCIVSDVMMPGLDGRQFARRLRGDPATASIPLLLLTALGGAEQAVRGLEAGADDYLAKPFDAGELLARIAAQLAQRRRLLHRLQREHSIAPAPPPGAEVRWLERLRRVVDAGLGDSGFGVDQMAKAMHTERTTLFRKLKQQLAQSPSELLREARLSRAHQLLAARQGNVTEVAYAVGFESLSSFARSFRTRFGYPPSAVPEAEGNSERARR